MYKIMTNSTTTKTSFMSLLPLLLLLVFSTPTAEASGTIELIVTAPRTVLIEPTVCATFECPVPDDLSTPRKVSSSLRFTTGKYQGETRERIDVHLKVLDPATNEIFAIEHHRPLVDTEWNEVVLTTTRGFNVTVQLRNKCDSNYHGARCGRFCIPSHDNHWECSPQGERRCLQGWSGVDCSIPICENGCNGRGKCIQPNQCACINGFNGTQCDQCVPRVGCVHGECHNGVPGTCRCRDGFIGDRCDVDIHVCSTQKPCSNGGRCSLDSKSPLGYKCDCPFDFVGAQCTTSLSQVRCAATAAQHVCQNGGACISMDERTIQCRCRPGFTGKFCEYGTRGDCSTMRCASPTATCHMSGDLAMCVEQDEASEEVEGKVGKKKTLAPGTTITKNRKEEMKKMKQEKGGEDLDDNILTISLLLLCVVGLILAIILGYFRYYVRVQSASSSSSPSTLPMTMTPPSKSSSSTSSSRPSTLYKVCIIDTERGCSSSSPTHHHHHPSSSSDSEYHHHERYHHYSPPPAYSAVMATTSPRVYRSIPTSEESTFRDPSSSTPTTSSKC